MISRPADRLCSGASGQPFPRRDYSGLECAFRNPQTYRRVSMPVASCQTAQRIQLCLRQARRQGKAIVHSLDTVLDRPHFLIGELSVFPGKSGNAARACWAACDRQAEAKTKCRRFRQYAMRVCERRITPTNGSCICHAPDRGWIAQHIRIGSIVLYPALIVSLVDHQGRREPDMQPNEISGRRRQTQLIQIRISASTCRNLHSFTFEVARPHPSAVSVNTRVPKTRDERGQARGQ